jgi:hypothetical protein
MKKLTVVFFCMLLFSCKKTEITTPSDIGLNSNSSLVMSRENECSSSTVTFPNYYSYSFDERCLEVGNLHNDYLTYFINNVVIDDLHPSDSNYDLSFRVITKNFFEEQGFVLDDDIYNCPSTSMPDESYEEYYSVLSNSAKQIFDDVYKSIESTEITISEFETEMESLYSQAKDLEDEKERIALCLMIKVGLSSVEYWESEIETWVYHFGNGGQSKLSSTAKIGISDAVGAFMGGIRGFLWGGPVGAFAGALLNAGWNSCTRAVVYGATGY